MSKYSNLLTLLTDFEHVSNKDYGYDPHGVAEDRQTRALRAIEAKLDIAFGKIIDAHIEAKINEIS